MTPQGISRALHQIEADLDATLFTREVNGITLTEEGRALESYAAKIIDTFNQARGKLDSIKNSALLEEKIDPIIVIGTPCALTYIMDIMGLHKRRTLPFSIHLRESNLFRVFDRIENSSALAVGLVSIPMTEKYTELASRLIDKHDLESVPFICSPLSVMMAEDNPLAKKVQLTRKDVQGVPVVCFRDSVLLDALDDFVMEDQIFDITNNLTILENQLHEWGAITYAPLISAIDPSIRNLQLSTIPFAPQEQFFSTQFGFVGTKETMADDNVRRLIDYVSSFFLNFEKSAERDTFNSCFTCSPNSLEHEFNTHEGPAPFTCGPEQQQV